MTGRHAAMPEPVDEDLGTPPAGAHRADTDAVPVVPADGLADASASADAVPVRAARRRKSD